MTAVQVKKSLKAPEKAGKYWRLVCMNGPNKGVVYYLMGKRIVLGRSDGTDITIEDSKTSREHAELTKIGEEYVISDLNSQNGVLINKNKIKQEKLKDGDKVLLGRTIYKYEFLKVKNPLSVIEDLLDKEEDEEEEEEIVLEGESKKKKKLLIGLFVILGVLYMLEDSPQKKSGQGKKGKTVEIKADQFKNINAKKDEYDKEMEEKLASLIQRGLREYREKNYFRAINEFNLALILHPNHSRASFYLRRTKQALDEEIGKNFLRAKREKEALKYEASIKTNCAIVKLLEGYQEDDRYLEAQSNIKELEKLMGYEESETKCL